MTLAILRLFGKHPDENERCIICVSGSEISYLSSWRTGMLKGPLPLLISRKEMQDDISVSLVGERKNELLLGLSRKSVKDLEEKKIFFLILVATLEKLKALAIEVGSDERV